MLSVGLDPAEILGGGAPNEDRLLSNVGGFWAGLSRVDPIELLVIVELTAFFTRGRNGT